MVTDNRDSDSIGLKGKYTIAKSGSQVDVYAAKAKAIAGYVSEFGHEMRILVSVCDGDPCMECGKACLLFQSGLLGSCMAATLGQCKVHLLLLRTGMLIAICTASLCLFVETIGNAGKHVG
jgi:hypothetical protein